MSIQRRQWLGIAFACLAWFVFAAWSNVPPYRGNVLEQPRGFMVWHWQLFSRGGEGICDVRYFDMKQGGAAIDRWSLFGYDSPHDMPDRYARTTKKQLFTEYKRVCWALRKGGDPAPEVEVAARCADHGAWQEVERRRRNVCVIGQTKPAKNKGASNTKGAGR